MKGGRATCGATWGERARRQRRCVPWEREIGAPRGRQQGARSRSFVVSRASAREDTPSVSRARHTRARSLAALSFHRTLHASPTRRRVSRAVRPHLARPRARPVRRADHQAGAFARGPLDAPTNTRRPPETPRLDPRRDSPPRVLTLAHRASHRAGFSTLRERRRRPSRRRRRLAKVRLHQTPERAPAQVQKGWLALPHRRRLRRRQPVHGSVRHVRGRHVRRR